MSDWRFYMQLIYVFSILIERAGTAIMVTSLRYLDLRLCIQPKSSGANSLSQLMPMPTGICVITA